MTEMSKEYASALFSLAREAHVEDEILDELKVVAKLMEDNPEILEFLAAPNISKRERCGALKKALDGQVHEYVLSFLQLLCDRERIRLLGECAEEFAEMLDEEKGVLTAKVESAVALTEDETRRLKRALEKRTGRTIRLECRVDESLLGGLVVTLGGEVLDGSLKHRLKEIREVMNR